MSPFEIIIIKTVYMYSIYLLIHINCIYMYTYILQLTWPGMKNSLILFPLHFAKLLNLLNLFLARHRNISEKERLFLGLIPIYLLAFTKYRQEGSWIFLKYLVNPVSLSLQFLIKGGIFAVCCLYRQFSPAPTRQQLADTDSHRHYPAQIINLPYF